MTIKKARLGKRLKRNRQKTTWALSIQPKIPEISVGTSNGTDHFGLVRRVYSGPSLKVVLFDRSGHFGRSDRNVPFHSTKMLSPEPLFCIQLTRTITKRAVACVGCVGATGMYRSIGQVEFPKFQTGIFVEWKASHFWPRTDRKIIAQVHSKC